MTTNDSVKAQYVEWLSENYPDAKPEFKWAICDRCEGEGHHGNPAFDGTSMDWWHESDPDGESFDNYMSGAWDVGCEFGCVGGKVNVPHAEPEVLAAWEQYQEQCWRDDADARAERAYFAQWG